MTTSMENYMKFGKIKMQSLKPSAKVKVDPTCVTIKIIADGVIYTTTITDKRCELLNKYRFLVPDISFLCGYKTKTMITKYLKIVFEDAFNNSVKLENDIKGLKNLLPRMGEWGFKRGGVKQCKKIVDEGLADRCETINNWLCYSMRGQGPKGTTLCYYRHMLYGNVVYQSYTYLKKGN